MTELPRKEVKIVSLTLEYPPEGKHWLDWEKNWISGRGRESVQLIFDLLSKHHNNCRLILEGENNEIFALTLQDGDFFVEEK